MPIAGPRLLTTLQTLADSGVILVNPWKPLILVITLAAWAWIISTVYDKHAARFFLPRKGWNLAHCIIGLVALIAAVAIPMPGEASFWIGWGVMLVLLMSSLVAYAVAANRDERVPDEFKIRMTSLSGWPRPAPRRK